jgi:hypothetical protein
MGSVKHPPNDCSHITFLEDIGIPATLQPLGHRQVFFLLANIGYHSWPERFKVGSGVVGLEEVTELMILYYYKMRI